VIDRLPYFCMVLLAVSAVSAQAINRADDTPSIVQCRRVAASGCGPDNVCIFVKIIDKNPITFDFRSKKYRSKFGSGRIHDMWDMPDGRHTIMVTSPPASTEFTFARDWKSAEGGYSCDVFQAR